MSAENQQERPDEGLCQYIAGFVDGEGSFHVAVQRNRSTRLGLQVIPEFHVSQNRERAEVLKLIKQVLGCGYLKTNHPGNLILGGAWHLDAFSAYLFRTWLRSAAPDGTTATPEVRHSRSSRTKE